MKNVIIMFTIVLALTLATKAEYIAFDNGKPSIYYFNSVMDRLLADDFTVTQDTILTKGCFWTMEDHILLWDGTLEYFIFANASGMPGTIISSGNGQNVVKNATGRVTPGGDEYKYYFEFGTPIDLDAGETYWFGLHMDADYTGWPYHILWSNSIAGLGYNCYESLGGTLDNWVNVGNQQAFYLEAVPEPGTACLLVMGSLALVKRNRQRP
ncbi:MAG: PEP-CTERM sorting domain-containing protein [Phycisphaerae bacterium]|nr:PEP-CTERM sorting domain-containing protein [Phycisphaerae bacterium]